MEFWSGLGNTILFVGLASCVFVFLVSLALPELGPRGEKPTWAVSIPIERWLFFAALAFTAAVALELASPWLDENVVGVLRVSLTLVGLVIVGSLLTRASIRIQERMRRG